MLRTKTALKTRTRLRRTPLRPRAKKKRGPRINYSALAIPKVPVRKPAMKEFADGRIIYNRRHPAGALGYDTAISTMAARQCWLCSICGKPMRYEERSFEHGNLRGGGKRNDDPNAIGPDGYYQNSAAHSTCNVRKGSRRNYPMALRLRPEDVLPAKELTK